MKTIIIVTILLAGNATAAPIKRILTGENAPEHKPTEKSWMPWILAGWPTWSCWWVRE